MFYTYKLCMDVTSVIQHFWETYLKKRKIIVNFTYSFSLIGIKRFHKILNTAIHVTCTECYEEISSLESFNILCDIGVHNFSRESREVLYCTCSNKKNWHAKNEDWKRLFHLIVYAWTCFNFTCLINILSLVTHDSITWTNPDDLTASVFSDTVWKNLLPSNSVTTYYLLKRIWIQYSQMYSFCLLKRNIHEQKIFIGIIWATLIFNPIISLT